MLKKIIDQQTIGDETPLMKAAEQGNIEIIFMLLKAGANPFIKNKQGRTADTYAEANHPQTEIHVKLR